MQSPLQCVQGFTVIEDTQDLSSKVDVGAEVAQEDASIDFAEMCTSLVDRVAS